MSFALDSDSPERTVKMFTVLYAPDYRNSIRFENWYVGRQDLGWVRSDCGVDAVRGDPDLSDVRTVKVRVTAPEGTPARFWLDDLRALPRPERGKVMVMFDDLRESQYPNAFPVMEEYGVPAGFATIVDNVGGTVTLDQIHGMERAGSEFVSHSMTGETMTELDGETRRRYLRESREWLEEHTLNPEAANHFVFPESKYGSGALADVHDRYEYAYVTGPGSAAGLTDPYTVNRINWDNYSLEEQAELLDRTARHRGLLIATLHVVEGGQVEKFERFCETLDGMRDRLDASRRRGSRRHRRT